MTMWTARMQHTAMSTACVWHTAMSTVRVIQKPPPHYCKTWKFSHKSPLNSKVQEHTPERRFQRTTINRRTSTNDLELDHMNIQRLQRFLDRNKIKQFEDKWLKLKQSYLPFSLLKSWFNEQQANKRNLVKQQLTIGLEQKWKLKNKGERKKKVKESEGRWGKFICGNSLIKSG